MMNASEFDSEEIEINGTELDSGPANNPTNPYSGWIMISGEVPTDPSPPQGAIFYGTPWPMPRNQIDPYKGKDLRRKENREIREAWNDHPVDERHPPDPVYEANPCPGSGISPNYKGALAIRYGGERIRVFPQREFVRVNDENLMDYLESTHVFRPRNASDEAVLEELRRKIEYMRTRGIPEEKSIVMAVSGLSEAEEEIPELGYWEMQPEYRAMLGLY